MRKIHAVVLVLFAVGSLGGKGCFDSYGDSWSKVAQPPPTKPWCQFDPPVGCRAICTDVGAIGFTNACDDISAGPLTASFRNAVGSYTIQIMMAGKDLCTQADIDNNVSVTPCQVGITPQPNPPESQDVCMNPPPGCAL
jgi:hypothetical protein